jgi:hypothetical protein
MAYEQFAFVLMGVEAEKEGCRVGIWNVCRAARASIIEPCQVYQRPHLD